VISSKAGITMINHVNFKTFEIGDNPSVPISLRHFQ
jgi:hypothetical protein